MKLSILIPVYNEINTLDRLFSRVQQLKLDKEILVVDDGSTDGSQRRVGQLKGKNVIVFFHQKNMGKGAAIKTALAHASGDIVVIQDADLEYDPAEIPKLIEPIIDGHADVVYGSRVLGANKKRKIWNIMYWYNEFRSALASKLFRRRTTDIGTCYKAFKTDFLRSLNFKAQGFDFDAEVTAKAFKSNIRFVELPVSYKGRSYQEGKKVTWKDGLVDIFVLFKNKLKR